MVPTASKPKASIYMITLLTALKETNVVLGELATECEDLHHLFLGDRLRQQLKLNRAVIALIENAPTIIQVKTTTAWRRRTAGEAFCCKAF